MLDNLIFIASNEQELKLKQKTLRENDHKTKIALNKSKAPNDTYFFKAINIDKLLFNKPATLKK